MPRITELFAFTIENDGPNDEGVIAQIIPPLGTTPLIGADMKRVNMLRPLAQEVANVVGKPVRLLKFSVREELDILRPHAQN